MNDWPEYVIRRKVTVGRPFAIVGGVLLIPEVEISTTASLIHDATGDPLVASSDKFRGEVGEQVVVELPVTDQPGYRDAATGDIIDVSEPNTHTHLYTATIRFLGADRREVAKRVIGPFALPQGDGTDVDLDKLLPAVTVDGERVRIPDLWTQLVLEAGRGVADAVVSADAAVVAANLAVDAAADAAAIAAEAGETAAAQEVKVTSLTNLTDSGRLSPDGLSATIEQAVAAGSQPPGAIGRLFARLARSTSSPVAVAFAGSSTTQGLNATTVENRFVDRLVKMMQAAYPSPSGAETIVQASRSAEWAQVYSAAGVHGYNAGDGGKTSADYITTAEATRIGSVNPAMVMHMIGSNDLANGITPGAYRANIETALDRIQASSSGAVLHILVHSYERFDSLATNPAHGWSEYGAKLREIAASRPESVVFLDLDRYYKTNGVPGADPLDLIDTDSIHQTNAGHAFMASLIGRLITLPSPSSSGPAKVIVVTTSTPVAGNIVAIDSFSRQNNASTMGSADTGQVWAPQSGTWGISDNRAYAVAAGTTLLAVGASDVDLTAEVTRPAIGTIGIAVRASGDTKRLALYFNTGSSVLMLAVIGGTTPETLGTYDSALGAGVSGTLRLKAVGTAVTAYLNGTAVMTATLSSAQAALLDGTAVALRATVTGPGAHFDNLLVQRP